MIATAISKKPALIFTLAGNHASEKVIEALRGMSGMESSVKIIFQDIPAIKEYFCEKELPADFALALFDDKSIGREIRGQFRTPYRYRNRTVTAPSWSMGTKWIVMVGSNCESLCCAWKIYADFGPAFDRWITNKEFLCGSGGHRTEKRVTTLLKSR